MDERGPDGRTPDGRTQDGDGPAPIEARQACRSCGVWEPRRWVEDARRGYCRREPPVVSASGEAVWPRTGEADWCAAWLPVGVDLIAWDATDEEEAA